MAPETFSGKPLTRREVREHLRHRLGLSGREADLILDEVLEAISRQLEDGGAVTLSGLGRFETRFTPARTGRNPVTGQEVAIAARLRPVFSLSRTLRAKIQK